MKRPSIEMTPLEAEMYLRLEQRCPGLVKWDVVQLALIIAVKAA